MGGGVGQDFGLEGAALDEAEENFHDGGIELRAGLALEDVLGFSGVSGLAVGAIAGHGVVGVDDVDDAGGEGDLFTAQAPGVAAAVGIFMVELDDGEVIAKFGDAFEDAFADDGMAADDFELGIGEGAGLLEDGVGDADFADVVEVGADADDVDFGGGEIHGAGDGDGVLADAGTVAGGVGVSGIEGLGHGLGDLQVGFVEAALGVGEGAGGEVEGAGELVDFLSGGGLGEVAAEDAAAFAGTEPFDQVNEGTGDGAGAIEISEHGSGEHGDEGGPEAVGGGAEEVAAGLLDGMKGPEPVAVGDELGIDGEGEVRGAGEGDGAGLGRVAGGEGVLDLSVIQVQAGFGGDVPLIEQHGLTVVRGRFEMFADDEGAEVLGAAVDGNG